MRKENATQTLLLVGNRSRLLIALLLLYFTGTSSAQKWLSAEEKEEHYTAMSIGTSIGTKGLIGVDYTRAINHRLNLRVGFNYMDFKINNFETNFGRFQYWASIDLETKQSSLEVLTEMNIWKGRVRLVTGAAYVFGNHLSGQIQLRDNTPLNDIELTPEEIGFLRGTITFRSPISPYFGMAFGNAFPKSGLGLSMDLGAYYRGKPLLDLDATNLVRTNTNNEEIVERNISSYRWWPVVSFRLAYKIL